MAASRNFEENNSSGNNKNTNNTQAGGNSPAASAIPASFNPIVRLKWTSPDKLYFQTAYVRLIPNEPINTFQRWHLLILSPQAAVLR
jgi:hypothetical protein